MNAKELAAVNHAQAQMHKYSQFGLKLIDCWVEDDEEGVTIHTRFNCPHPRRLKVMEEAAKRMGFNVVTFHGYLKIVQ